MKLKLQKPLAIFDLEATGLNISKDRIVEIAIVKINPDGTEDHFSSRINPEMEIPAEVSEIHGITNEMIADSPTLKDIEPQLVAFIGDADLGGYNSNKFDIPMLAEELLRIESDFDVSGRKFVDVQNIFHKMEQRTLAAAYQFYCQKELNNAHNAMADTTATWEVLKAQLERYGDLEPSVEYLADFSKASAMTVVDFAGRLGANDKNEVVYNFGKHKGKTVQEVHGEEPGYYGWFISDSTDFPKYTKQKLKEEMDRLKKEGLIDKPAPRNAAGADFREQKKKEKKDELSYEDKLAALAHKFGKK